MPEWVERMMHALGWMPTERERALEEALDEARSSQAEDRAALEAVKRELIRTTGSWEMAEMRVRELVDEQAQLIELWGDMSTAVCAGRNYKLQVLGRIAAEMDGGRE